ncbi:MAG: hypothetical protein Q9162_007177 [Coniocarpon cinnabarinum]
MSQDGGHSVFFESESATNEEAREIADSVKPQKSNLDLINETDSFPYYTTNPSAYTHYTETHYHLLVADHIPTLGLVLPSVAEVFRNIPGWELDEKLHTLTLVAGKDRQSRSAVVAATAAAMRATGHFQVLSKWRDELYPVFAEDGTVLFDIERAASALFGIVTYGCHMTMYVKEQVNGEEVTRIWVPRRARHKETYGGMLDNTVAGGLSCGETPFSGLVREAEEEASLDPELIRTRAKAAGTVSYFHIRDARAGGERGLLQPECQYVYDMDVGADVIPKPSDGEVEGFELMGVEEVKKAMAHGEFKPNCALVLLDFFIRRGDLTAEEDDHYAEIVSRLHRVLEFPTARSWRTS